MSTAARSNAAEGNAAPSVAAVRAAAVTGLIASGLRANALPASIIAERNDGWHNGRAERMGGISEVGIPQHGRRTGAGQG